MFIRKHAILIILILLGFAAIGAWAMSPVKELWRLYVRPIQGGNIPAASPLVEVTHDRLTVQLVHAISSSSHTVVQFALKHPDFPGDLEAMYKYSLFSPLQPGKDMIMKGFAENVVYSRRESREPGALLLLLELAPPAQPDAPVTIEFRELRIHNAETQKVLTFRGPWVFTFVPQRATTPRPLKRISLNKTLKRGKIRVDIRELLLSETESVVTYRFSATAQMLGGPRLSCDGHTYPGRDRGVLEDGWQQTSFPALSPDVSNCQLIFGPFLTFTPADIRFVLHWDRLTQGGEDVRVDDYMWHFEPPVLMADRTEITYTPANEAAKRLVLVTSSETVQVVDEKGVVYPVESWRLGFDPETWVVERQTLYFRGLVEPGERLNVRVTQVGRIEDEVTLDVPTNK